MSVSICVNDLTDRVVPERLCADEPRPRPSIRSCPYVVCPAKTSNGLDYTWLLGDWSECSASCGGGRQTRDIFCVESHPSPDFNATTESASSYSILTNASSTTVWNNQVMENRKVANQYCWQLQKPVTQRDCGLSECPYWQSGDWSGCSASCGSGVRRRKVHCRQMGGNMAERFCPASARPIAEQICYTGVPCDQTRSTNERVNSPFGSSWRRDVFSAEEDAGADVPPPPSSAAYQYFPPTLSDGGENGLVGFDASMDSTKPRFHAGTWSECSASCGAGIRSRLVECVAVQGVTADTIKLPDYECDGQAKPILFQPCQLRACTTDGVDFPSTNTLDEPEATRFIGARTGRNVSETVDASNMREFVGATEVAADSSAYRWEYDDWGACSASCLGGKQKSLAKCVYSPHNRTVARTYCDAAGLQRPADLTRTCNQEACPPAWETSEFSECSHSCGGGIRTRRVRCTRTVARASTPVGGIPSTLILPEAQCPAPKPKEQQPCGMVDCEPEWKLSKWSQCSTSCGAGEQRRTALCQQRDALGTVHIHQPTVDDASTAASQQPRCGSVQRPPTVRLCNLGSCADFNLPAVVGPQFALPLRQNDVDHVLLVRHNHRPRDNSRGDGDNTNSDDDDTEGETTDEAAERWNAENSFDQSHPKHRKLTLDVGGIANLYEGTSLKVKCPVRNFRRDAIHWTRNGNRIVNNAHTKVSTNGALRIFHARMEDAGFYECFAGSGEAVGNVTLHFKRHHDDTTVEKSRKSKLKSGNRTSPKSPMTTEILQKVKENLYRVGEFRTLDALNTVSDPSRLGIEFYAGEWSECSAETAVDDECRSFARRLASTTKRPIQVRLLKCRIRVSHLVAEVDEEICESMGAPRPPSTRPCTQTQPPTHCPRWTVGEWAACSKSRCIVSGTALQRRDVTCAYGNGTLVTDAMRCDRKSRPKFKRECVNSNCVAEWRTSAWGKCSKACGDGGVQMRLLRCTWHGTRKPAGRNCNTTRRPIAVRMCDVSSLQLSKCSEAAGAHLAFGEDNNTSKFHGNSSATKSGAAAEPLRTADNAACEDESRFCDILRLFQACDTPELRQKCCYSCHHTNFYASSRRRL